MMMLLVFLMMRRLLTWQSDRSCNLRQHHLCEHHELDWSWIWCQESETSSLTPALHLLILLLSRHSLCLELRSCCCRISQESSMFSRLESLTQEESWCWWISLAPVWSCWGSWGEESCWWRRASSPVHSDSCHLNYTHHLENIINCLKQWKFYKY